jgi:tripartite ATP-independent transporter DctM subunit
MSWWEVLLIALALKIVLAISGLPIYLCFILIVGGATLLFFGSAGYGMFVNSLYTTGTAEALTTIPLFILMGEILCRSGSIDVLFNAIDKLIGRLRGRQYHLTLILSAILGAPAGSGIAVAALLGRSVMGPMIKRGYDARLTSSVILAGALLAPIIPPSVLAIIIGTIANVSISALLLAGIIPGLVLTLLYMGGVAVEVLRNPKLAPEEEYVPYSRKQKLWALVEMLPFSLVIFVSIGLIMLGVATPSEAAALGVISALLEAAIRGKLTMHLWLKSLSDSAILSAVILIIIATAILFSQILAYTGAIHALSEATASVNLPNWLLFALMMLVPFILCIFVDQVGIMMIVIPIYEPILKIAGFDPVWFWLQFLIVMVLGAILPPFGYILFALKAAVPEVSLRTVYSSAWLVLGLSFLGMALFTAFPSIVTIVPDLLKK